MGYEIERFVNLSQTEKTELTCSICQDILECAVVTHCCLQSFCQQCIHNWLTNNNTCPYDRKNLTINQLSKPPRAMINMLGMLKIRCDFRAKGCKEVIALENLNNHLQQCKYNNENKKCKKCFCDNIKTNHDCVIYLLEINKKLNNELNQLKKSYDEMSKKVENNISKQKSSSNQTNDSLIKEINELKKEKQNFLKTISNISNDSINSRFISSIPSTSTSTSSSSSNSTLIKVNPNSNTTITSSLPMTTTTEQQIFIESRKHINSQIILQNEMNKQNTTQIITIVNERVRQHNTMFEVCKSIVEKLNDEYGSRWHCIVSYDRLGGNSFFSFQNGYRIKLKYGKLIFDIYKTQFLNVKQLRQRFISKKIKREINILRTDMKQSMINDLKKITFNALEKCETLSDITTEIKKQMESKYSSDDGQQQHQHNMWQCFIFAYFGHFVLNHKIGKFISYEIGEELVITVFQTIQ